MSSPSNGAWGSGQWGAGAWGGGFGTALVLLTAQAIRENTIRLTFSVPAYFSTILDRYDASDPSHYAIVPLANTFDDLGQPTRVVNIVTVERPTSFSDFPVPANEVGMHIDLRLDRPMSSFPGVYTVTITNLQNAKQTSTLASLVVNIDAVFREVQKPVLEVATPVRDFANPQTLSALDETKPHHSTMSVLGTIPVSEDGDYAFDIGNTGRKKRVFRRLITRKNGFAHLPGYGVGLIEYGKQLARLGTVGKLSTDCRLQIEKEPDITKASVTTEIRGSKPGLLRLHIAIKPRGGLSQKFTADVPLT